MQENKITVRNMTKEQREYIEKRAKTEERTLSAVIRRIIDREMENHRHGK